MSSSLIIANFATGLETDRKPFIINNDAFPTMTNAYVWRGRILKKRGTIQLGRLQVNLSGSSLGNTSGSGALSINIITFLTLPSSSSIVLGSITVTVGAQIFTETSPGVLSNGGAGTGTINYATGLLTIQTAPVLAATAVTISFGFYPDLPVLGLENFISSATTFPVLVAFDTTYSYQINQNTQIFYNVTFYKITGAPFTWQGANYQQFWSTNYQGAMWVTNGNAGFHFLTITNVTFVLTTVTVTTSAAHGLVTGDYVFLNEVVGLTGINGVSGPITVTGANTFTIVVPVAPNGAYISGGIVQSLTRSIPGAGDGIKWYDGDPTVALSTKGWVNFAPPLARFDATIPAFATKPDYLIGAQIIVPFKNRLLFFGVTLGRSDGTTVSYPNRFVYSQVGTPYYSAPAPTDQVVDPTAWFENVAGKGGFLQAPIPQRIITVQENKDVLIVGFESQQSKLIFTGNDSFPFFFQSINEELGSECTFSGVNLDIGVLTIGPYGIVMTSQVSSQRIDLAIPDAVFGIAAEENGLQRVSAVRDFRNEFIYFSFPPQEDENFDIYPSQTLLYNYRDNTWALFEENYTHYGTYRKSTNYTWGTLNKVFATWATWSNAWNFGIFGAQYPDIIGGNQQGFVMIKDKGTKEGISQYISGISGSLITSPDHCLNDEDFIEISGVVGDASMEALNGTVQKILEINDKNHFTIESTTTGTYLGGGVYVRLANIDVKSKQFPIYWSHGRKARIGTQRFLMENSGTGEITVSIFSDQNSVISLNNSAINPYLIYTDILLTHSETTADYSAVGQDQIWHRLSNSFVGGTVQIGFSLSDDQMRNTDTNSVEIGIHAIAFDIYPGPILV